MKKVIFLAIFSLIAASAGFFANTPRVVPKDKVTTIRQKENKENMVAKNKSLSGHIKHHKARVKNDPGKLKK